MTQVRTAIIGAGVMGREHVKALRPLSEVQITTRLWLAGAMAAALGVAIGLVGTW